MANANLLEAMREKANPSAPAPKSAVAPQSNGKAGAETPPRSREGKRQIAGYFPAAVQKQLKLLMVENDTTVQNLMAEAFNDLFAKYGKPEIAPIDQEG